MQYTLAELADRAGLELQGDGAKVITSIAPLKTAETNQLSFLSSPKMAAELSSTSAGAVIVKADLAPLCDTNVLISDNPYLSFAKLSGLFDQSPVAKPGIHQSATVSNSAKVAVSASIGANAVIGDGVIIGERSVIGANTVVDDYCEIGDGCHIHANVTLYHRVVMGDDVCVHSATVIGGDGFGFAPAPKEARKWQKIHQLGGVRIGNRVDIGACTSIDRGTLEDTVLEDDVIIDNQVHVAHNCVIGQGSALAGCVGLAGSSIIGKFCTLAGGVGIAGHLSICDHVHVTGMTMVTKSITEPGAYSSGTPMMPTRDWKRSAVRFGQLDKLQTRVKKLETDSDN
ncbi:UDP-3-O-acylglucosamine N-acyltransferase [BD1-7 clade bacterium]|uniref:UDP-3-O-acylglucosamine N-acyltransferase n=1 Tax=BD1-7 clade bacterium TaxID=2029982 RepID=A0A5S9PVB0_9GAMM|nr:UDP-3-O-acylglucosamine N-acyltransferase [BD1-7 clade bacterium]